MPSYLTPEETAQQLKVNVDEITTLIEHGKLRAIRIGDSIRIPEPEIETLLVTSSANPRGRDFPDTTFVPENSRLVVTMTGRAKFKVSGSISAGLEIWPGKMRYPIKFPKPILVALLAHFSGRTVPIGGSFDGPTPGSLGEFIQRELKTKMNPAVYLAALLIDEGYADVVQRGHIRIHLPTETLSSDIPQEPKREKNLVEICAMVRGLTEDIDFNRNSSTGRPVELS